MKQVLFSQDDRFFLHLQRRDMIHTSESETEQEMLKLKDLSSSRQQNQLNSTTNISSKRIQSVLHSSDDEINAEERAEKLREILNRFQKRKLKPHEFRILQGVFQQNFGSLEQ